MYNIKQLRNLLNVFILLMMLILMVYGDFALFTFAYIVVTSAVIVHTLFNEPDRRLRMLLITSYILILIGKLVFSAYAIFGAGIGGFRQLMAKLIGVTLLYLPMYVEHVISIRHYTRVLFPSIEEMASISYSQFRHNRTLIRSRVSSLKKAGKSISPANVEEILKDLPRHSATRYINNGSLTNAYFEKANNSLDDPHVYIVISNTGSAASEVISVFTNKQYNHVSLAFDQELETIISYNGGENLYPPGLNAEMIEYFNKKSNASIMVYKLKCTLQQKKALIDKVCQINLEGSAYNILGLILRYSHKPNIMFCSQFVYKMLESVGLQYFVKAEMSVKPTDFIELDYKRKLEFVCEIQFQ